MVETKMVVFSSSISSKPLSKSRVVFKTKERIPTTFVTVESLDHSSMERISKYESVFVSIEDADVIRCTCIAKELTDPRCPEHGD